MSDGSRNLDSQKSRQELLDEIYRLRDVAGEREHCAQGLAARLDRSSAQVDRVRDALQLVLASRSWRLTRPLRSLKRRITGRPDPDDLLALAMSGADGAMTQEVARPAAARPSRTRPGASARTPSLVERRVRAPALFVDITELVSRHGRTGVQRMTREILRALLVSPPAGHGIVPVVARPGEPYRVARGFDAGKRCPEEAVDLGGPIWTRKGDVFLGLDHAMSAVVERAADLEAMRRSGVGIWFVCNDTLPLSHPEWFPAAVHAGFRAWFEVVVRLSDGIACVSAATREDVRRWAATLPIDRRTPLRLEQFPLGSDMAAVGDAGPVTTAEQAMIDRFKGKPSFLMVGTVEPRKGHDQALEAFNLLWARGSDAVLVIAGLPGWMTDVTQRRIRHHDELGKRLFWFTDVDDALLDQLYRSCDALLVPSRGEGFGLPLVEAAQHNLPILARDLPVFREGAEGSVTYFTGGDAGSLASALREWLERHQGGGSRTSTAMQWLTWAQSARQLLDVMHVGSPAFAFNRVARDP